MSNPTTTVEKAQAQHEAEMRAATPRTDTMRWAMQNRPLTAREEEILTFAAGVERELAVVRAERDEARKILAKESGLRLAEWCKEERAMGNGGCGGCAVCCNELRDANDKITARLASAEAANAELLHGLKRVLKHFYTINDDTAVAFTPPLSLETFELAERAVLNTKSPAILAVVRKLNDAVARMVAAWKDKPPLAWQPDCLGDMLEQLRAALTAAAPYLKP